MNNTEPTKNRVWTQVLAKVKQFLFPIRHAVLLIVKSGNSLVDDIS
jgi:hypothetical protein